MRENLQTIRKWSSDCEYFFWCRVIETWGSSPRPVGSSLFVQPNGLMIGSVSGGCIETQVVKECLAMESLSKTVSFGVSDEDAWQVGLSCGGEVKVLIEKVYPSKERVWESLLNELKEDRSAVLVSDTSGETKDWELVKESENEPKITAKTNAFDFSNELLNNPGASSKYDEESKTFYHLFQRKPLLLIIGAAHISVELIDIASSFDFRTAVIDPRGFFTENIIFKKNPDQLITEYPSRCLNNFNLGPHVFAAILSHDPKIDDDALKVLLKSNAGYIGALGSKKNQERRKNRLLQMGFSTTDVNRIDGPIGIDIKSRSAREIALSIMAGMIKVKNASR